MKIEILSPTARSQQTLDLPKIIVERRSSSIAIYHSVNAELANRRIGSASTKARSAVAGSNIKPWRQKGTGRARAGSRKSPIWRGGGTVFGPHPRDYHTHLPRKQRAVAFCTALCRKAEQKRLFAIDPISIIEAKTKLLSNILSSYLHTLEIDEKQYCTVLIITNDSNKEDALIVRRAGRNIPYLSIQQHSRISSHTFFYSDYVFIYKASFDAFATSLDDVFRKRAAA